MYVKTNTHGQNNTENPGQISPMDSFDRNRKELVTDEL